MERYYRMRKTVISTLFLLWLIIMLNCQGQYSPVEPDQINFKPKADVLGSTILFSDLMAIRVKTDPLGINRIQRVGDSLYLEVSYSGGCRTHRFILYVWTGMSKSNPPQVEIYLSHDSRRDYCEAYIIKNVVFDLSPLKTHWKENYPGIHEILLRIYPPGSSVPYQPLTDYRF